MLKSKARVFTDMAGFAERICWARLSSFDWVREIRRRLKGVRERWRANSLPRPSEAPVMIAQLDGGPKVRSWMGVGVSLWRRFMATRWKRETYGFSWEDEEGEDKANEAEEFGGEE